MPGPMLLLPPGRARSVVHNDVTASFLASGIDTAGRVGVAELILPPRSGGVPRHEHHRATELIYLADGEARLGLGERTQIAQPGTFMLVPPRTAHCVDNPTDAPARVLLMLTPCHGCEQYLRELALLLDGAVRPSAATLANLARTFDHHPV